MIGTGGNMGKETASAEETQASAVGGGDWCRGRRQRLTSVVNSLYFSFR